MPSTRWLSTRAVGAWPLATEASPPAQLRHSGEAGPHGGRGKHRGGQAWLVGKALSRHGARHTSARATCRKHCPKTVATWQRLQPSVLFVSFLNSSLRHGATSRAACRKNLFATRRVDHDLATRAPAEPSCRVARWITMRRQVDPNGSRSRHHRVLFPAVEPNRTVGTPGSCRRHGIAPCHPERMSDVV